VLFVSEASAEELGQQPEVTKSRMIQAITSINLSIVKDEVKTVIASSGISYFLFFAIIHTAWTIPGIIPRIVRTILIQKCFPNPTCRNAATGGKIIAQTILINSFIVVNRCLSLCRF
jgi:hypothetical protein